MSTIVVAGASGFIGQHLVRTLRAQGHHVIGLTRGKTAHTDGDGPQEWRPCDLFSSEQTVACLRGADFAFYLVHSMSKSARLTQAKFEDCDLLAALNFALACEVNKVKQIVYLGGLIPGNIAQPDLSRHLRSRLEVEQVLGSTQIPLTTLRSGLVIGTGGSSFQMLYRLSRYLPFMVLPRWTRIATTPICLDDVIALLGYVLNRPECIGQTYDIGGPDTLPYRELLSRTAQAIGKTFRFINIPFFSPRLSRLWVSLISRQPRALVAPLIESLKYPMVPRDRRLQLAAGLNGRSVDDAIAEAIPALMKANTSHKTTTRTVHASAKPESTVRSIQRITAQADFFHSRVATHVGEIYFNWLPTLLFFIAVVRNGNDIEIRVRPFRTPLLKFVRKIEPELNLEIFQICGGLLTLNDTHGFLEFRPVPNTQFILSVVESFQPRLPWYFYKFTQAILHRWVMDAFGRHIAQMKGSSHAHAPASKSP